MAHTVVVSNREGDVPGIVRDGEGDGALGYREH